MLRWVLKCPQCKIHFTHSEVYVGRKQYGIWMLPSKPEFHEGGSWIKCPTCNTIPSSSEFNLDTWRQGEQVDLLSNTNITIRRTDLGQVLINAL
jgi:hypothetical protein